MKKLLLILVIAIFVVSMLVSGIGCKEETAVVEETETEEVAVEETETEEVAVEETETEEATVEEASGEPKTLVVWVDVSDTEPAGLAWIEVVNNYKEVHPEITIEMYFGGRDVINKLMPARAAGEKIDLITSGYALQKSSLIDEGFALTLDDYLETPSFDGDTSWRESLMASILESAALEDGSIPMLCQTAMTSGFTYNKKLWRDNGWVVPQTWDEYLALCETIKTTTDIAPIAQDGGIDFYNIMWNYLILQRMLGVGAITDATENETGESWISNPAFKQSIEMEKALIANDYFIEGFTGFTWPAGQNELAFGNAAMELNGSWLPMELSTLVDDDWEWGFFPVPAVDGGKGKTTEIELFTTGWVVLNDGENIPESIDFLKFLSSKSQMQIVTDLTNVIYSTLGVTPPGPQADVVKIFENATATFRGADTLQDQYPEFFSGVYIKNHELAFKGDMTPEEFVNAMKADTISFWENK